MSEEIELNLLDDKARVAGLVLMSITITSVLGLAVWTVWCRKSPPVMAMQPFFLTMLAFGIVITNLAIVPLSMDESTTSSLDAACMSYTWLNSLGATFILSAFFSKLWRINQIFTSAERFRRKAVTAKDVLWPFAILFSTNLLLLIIMTAFGSVVWARNSASAVADQPVTVGYCKYDGPVGKILEPLIALVNFVALILVCIQAYKSRNIRSEFSDSRGILMAVFAMLEGVLVHFPSFALIENSNTDAKYVSVVVLETVTSWCILFFIFGPVIAEHRKLTNDRRAGNSAKAQQRPLALARENTESGHRTDTDCAMISMELREARNQISELQEQIRTLKSTTDGGHGQEHQEAGTYEGRLCGP